MARGSAPPQPFLRIFLPSVSFLLVALSSQLLHPFHSPPAVPITMCSWQNQHIPLTNRCTTRGVCKGLTIDQEVTNRCPIRGGFQRADH